MKIALSQWGLPVGGRLARVEAEATLAGAAGCDLLLLPELILPGYNVPARHAAEAQPLDGRWSGRIAAIAQAAGVAICYGWAERQGERIFNAASVIGVDGRRLAHYRKLQLFGPMEQASFAPGNAPPPVFALAGQTIGLLICYDIEFPEHARDLARRGASLVLVPTANPEGFDHVQRLLVPTRAYENRMTVAYANYAGPDHGLTFGGGSVICGPDGGAIVAAGGGDAMLIADLPGEAGCRPELLSTQLADLRLPEAKA